MMAFSGQFHGYEELQIYTKYVKITLMTQIQKRFIALLCACVLVAVSFLLWTNVVSGAVSLRMWNTLLATVQEVSPEMRGVEEKSAVMHAAAPQAFVAASVAMELLPQQLQETVSKTPENTRKDNEWSQWELRQWFTLSIPSIGVRTSVSLPSRRYWDAKQWQLLEEQMQIGLLYGATAYPHSAVPGHKGTVIISGHSSPPDSRAEENAFGNLFARLPEIQEGESIILVMGNDVVRYRVDHTEIVHPDATVILQQQQDESLLKLITCFPIGTTRSRYIVTAVLEE